MQATLWDAPAPYQVADGAPVITLDTTLTIGEAAALLRDYPSITVPRGVASLIATNARKLGINCRTVYHGDDGPAEVVLIGRVLCSETFEQPLYPSTNKPGSIHVEVKRQEDGGWIAACFAQGPNQYCRQIAERFTGGTLEDARKLAEEWMGQEAHPFIARELANQIDYVEITDPGTGKVLTGELFGTGADSFWPDSYVVKLHSPAEYSRAHRDGIAKVERALVRKVDPVATAA